MKLRSTSKWAKMGKKVGKMERNSQKRVCLGFQFFCPNTKCGDVAQTNRLTDSCMGFKTSGGGLHKMGKGSVRAAIVSERYLSDVEVKLHNMHMHDQVFITNNDEHVEEIAMKQ